MVRAGDSPAEQDTAMIGTMTLATETDVDLDRLVAEMLSDGPDRVTCPEGLPDNDFKNIQAIINRVIDLFHPHERYVPWQSGPRSMNWVTLMELLKSRDYQAADDYFVVEADFIPA